MKKEPIPHLRELLSSEPSEKSWQALSKLFRKWKKSHPDDLSMLLDYASEHLDHWPMELRIVSRIQPEDPAWSLARACKLTQGDLDVAIPALAEHPHLVRLSIHKTLTNTLCLAGVTQLVSLEVQA